MRNRLLGGVLAFSALCAIAGRAEAAQILYYVDDVLGTDEMAAALAALPSSDTVVTATSELDFANKLNGGGYNLAILFVQDYPSSSYPDAVSALTTFIAGGGKAIGDDWYVYGDNAYISAFNASYTGNANDSTVTVTDPKLTSGVSSPLSLYNPGWATFSYGLNALSGGSVSASFGSGDGAIILGNGGKTYFNGFLSDTFSTPSDGVNLYTNEINALLSSASVPEPSSIVMAATGLAFGLIAIRRRRYQRGGRLA